MLRFWAKQTEVGARASLAKEELSHARVRRVREGEVVGLIDGKGWKAEGVFREGSVEITRAQKLAAASPAIILYMALTASSAFETVLDSAAELGVAKIVPVFSQNAFYRVADKSKLLNKYPRWEKILKESCKQSGNPFLPELASPILINELATPTANAPIYLAALEGQTQNWAPISSVQSVGLLVGPEGDFSPEEYQKLNQIGITPISLGANVLRSQTAALAMIVTAQALINRL